MLFGRNGKLPSAWRIMIKSWGKALLRGMIKIEQVQFFDSQMYYNNLNTITLKLFHDHGGIYRFRKKFKKDSGENCEGLGW